MVIAGREETLYGVVCPYLTFFIGVSLAETRLPTIHPTDMTRPSLRFGRITCSIVGIWIGNCAHGIGTSGPGCFHHLHFKMVKSLENNVELDR